MLLVGMITLLCAPKDLGAVAPRSNILGDKIAYEGMSEFRFGNVKNSSVSVLVVKLR